MSLPWMLGTGALLVFLAGTANAQQETKAEGPKAGAVEAKPAPEKAAAESKAPKSQLAVKVKKLEHKLPLDSYGKPIHERFVDSKDRSIPVTEVPLEDAFLCYPPPGGARTEKEAVKKPLKEMPAKEMSVRDVPKEYVCTPYQPDYPALRMLMVTCQPPLHGCVTSSGLYACCR